MDINSYIYEGIFEEKEKYKIFYELVWEQFLEDGFVVTDEGGNEIDAVLKAVSLQNLLGEFVYRVYDEINEIDFEDVVEHLQDLGISEEEFYAFCEEDENIFTEDDNDSTFKNALDYVTEIVADKILEDFNAEDVFDYMFCASYDFEQDFTFDFEDTDEFQAFVDSNQEKLDGYKEEYPSVLDWVESGMIV